MNDNLRRHDIEDRQNRYPSVIKIYTTSQDPDYDCPWQAQSLYSGTGSGVLIDNNQILTAAHVVANQTFLQVQKSDLPDKVTARVAAISHECDLALLEVDDEHFLDGIPPVSIGALPEPRDKVTVVGFPIGGEELSLTEGVVSRIEVQYYTHSQRKLMAITIDAAINSGNSGGPVFKNGQIIGIAFQSRTDGENLGEIVPPPIIDHFIRGARRGHYQGFPGLGVTCQTLENPVLRQRLKMAKDQHGILIARVHYGNSCWGHVHPGDVLMAIDDSEIANNATVRYAGRYRTLFDSLLHHFDVGEQTIVTILRDGQVHKVPITLKPSRPLVPRSRYDVSPSYFIFGGLVFQPLSRDYLQTWDRWRRKAPRDFVHLYFNGVQSAEQQEIVLFASVLADQINVGYDAYTNEAISTVNGVAIKNMRHFCQVVESANDYLEIRTSLSSTIVLDVTNARTANERILERYRISHSRSEDLRSAE